MQEVAEEGFCHLGDSFILKDGRFCLTG